MAELFSRHFWEHRMTSIGFNNKCQSCRITRISNFFNSFNTKWFKNEITCVTVYGKSHEHSNYFAVIWWGIQNHVTSIELISKRQSGAASESVTFSPTLTRINSKRSTCNGVWKISRKVQLLSSRFWASKNWVKSDWISKWMSKLPHLPSREVSELSFVITFNLNCEGMNWKKKKNATETHSFRIDEFVAVE